MPHIKRRQFLQFAGSAVATFGLSQVDIQNRGDRFAKVLAQGTPRKLALLIGINAYDFAPLQGCVTDVDLQRQLLTNRFGFNPKDILTLTDTQATRGNILAAFEEHLIKQAKPGDVVLFHFSGHGSRVNDPDCDNPQDKCQNSTFVPVDYKEPTKSGVVQDIMGHTLFLLMYAVKTENLTVVLDSCHSGGGTRGNIRVRSRPVASDSPLQAVSAEREYQQQWLSRLNLSPQEFIAKRKAGVAKGVVLAAARSDQTAADASIGDFSAGAFTYTMTQYLWQQTGNAPFGSVLPNIARNISHLSSQQPQIEAEPGKDFLKQPIYFIAQQTPPAEAVITKVEGTQAELWLGGLDQQSLVAFNKDAVLTVVDSQGREQGLVKLESRQGLVGRGQLLKNAKPGAFLQERARDIPSDLTLKIGLDSSLGNDTQAAKQALQAIRRIEPVRLQQTDVQYIFGRITSANRQQLQLSSTSNIPPTGSLGLFSPSLEPIPNSFGSASESVTHAVDRLQAKLKSLLAVRIVKTTLNTNSSRLNIVASMRPEGGREILATTTRGSLSKVSSASNNSKPIASPDGDKLPLKTSVQLSVTNNESTELYCSVMVIDPTGEISVIFPNQWTATDDVTKVRSGQTLLIPDSQKDNFTLVTQEPKGVAEVLILASRTPLRKALQALRQTASRGGSDRGPVALNDPSEVVGSLLDDLNEAGRGTNSSSSGSNSSVRGIDTTQMASLSITFEVI